MNMFMPIIRQAFLTVCGITCQVFHGFVAHTGRYAGASHNLPTYGEQNLDVGEYAVYF